MSDANKGVPQIGADFALPVSDAVIAAAIPGFSSETERSLARRYGGVQKYHETLTFEFSRDPALLHQYYRIYEEQFRAVHHAHRYEHGVEDEHDRTGHILIVRRGNLCVGGARVSFKTPRQPKLLPIEIGNFRLEDHFPQLGIKQMRYGQVGRFCLLPEFRGGEVTREMQRHITRKAVAMNLDMFFATAPLLNARVYKQNCIAIGFKDVKIHFDINLPEYPMCEEVKFYLISGYVNKSLESDIRSKPVGLHAYLYDEEA